MFSIFAVLLCAKCLLPSCEGATIPAEEMSDVHARVRRLSLPLGSDKFWPKGVIPYIFADSLRSQYRQDYKDIVFPLYHKYSCIKFVQWTSQTKEQYGLGHDTRLVFMEDNGTCSSNVGSKLNNGNQSIHCCKPWKCPVFMSTGSLLAFGLALRQLPAVVNSEYNIMDTCIHELAHALGMYHEQESPIRDDLVRINYQNIQPGASSQFSKEENSETFGIYDVDSAMHYGLKAWSSNGEETITLLDPSMRPASQFADKETYFYLFMEINTMYQCTADCDVTCVNGGYGAHVDGACACRCPEGLDPSSNCETLLKKDYNCGAVLDLDDTTDSVTITSTDIIGKNKPKTCYWFVKSPPGSRLLMTVPNFSVRTDTGGACVDELAVRPYLPGLWGSPYCGDMFFKAVMSASNMLAFSFTQAPTEALASSFTAVVRFKKESEFCYPLETKGTVYGGRKSFTDDMRECIHWDRTDACTHSLFNKRDVDANLEANYCRNPDNSAAPWCYTNITTCARAYCDACQLGVCRNAVKGCIKRVNADESQCGTDPVLRSECRNRCGLCDDHSPVTGIDETRCPPPELPADATDIEVADSYQVGESIKITCNTSDDFRYITCLSNGTWTPLNYVCGMCLPGWMQFGLTCLKLTSDRKKRFDAETVCSKERPGAKLPQPRTRKENNFLKSLLQNGKGECTSVWLDLLVVVDSPGEYNWGDETTPAFSDWADDKPTGKMCTNMNSNCEWTDSSCSYFSRFACQYDLQAPVICADQRSDCAVIAARNNNFCKKEKFTFALVNCRKFCGLCT